MCSNVVGVVTGVLAYFALHASRFSADLGFLQWLLPVIAGLLVSLAVTSMGNAVATRTLPER
ncbi:hypothetical protein [Aeromicrobium sp. Leaf350]|uniref:hypothetical protein n=1 Tax=Aeromicrobium sp. Leaf350 TaxID=2876565 RepID=UPI001E487A5F|nr:hypothetical protein [Aeromicrobium sp. Leaf350]